MKKFKNILVLLIIVSILGFKTPEVDPEPIESSLPHLNIALFLPLHLHDYEARKSGTSKFIYDYYEGVQAALRDLEKMGMNLTLHVFDTEMDSSRVDSLFKLPRMRKMNTIVGPVFPKYQNIAEEFCAKTKIPLISPFRHHKRSVLDSFPHINLIPSDSVAAFGEGQGMARLYPNYPLFVISDAKGENYLNRKLFKDGFALASKSQITQLDQTNLGELYTRSSKGTVIVYAPTDSAEILKKLSNLAATGRIKLALPKNSRKITGFGMNEMIRGKVHFADNDFYYKYEDRALAFRKMYRMRFRWEANKWHFKGYDQFMWLGQSMMTFRQQYPSGLRNAFYSGIMEQYSLKQSGKGGFENSGCKIVRYISSTNKVEVNP